MFMTFPEIPLFKRYFAPYTLEQQIVFKLSGGQHITKPEEAILHEAISFYRHAFAFLKSINLSVIDDDDARRIKAYLKAVIGLDLGFKYDPPSYNTFRTSIVRKDFLEADDKVRLLKFLSYPSIEIVKNKGQYGRANSFDTTRFYCSFYPGVSVLETKPQIGDRIIVSNWFNITHKRFCLYPLSNCKDIQNKQVIDATNAYNQEIANVHLLLGEILNMQVSFLASEFVKDVPIVSSRKYEYLYSAYFADTILDSDIELPSENPDKGWQYDGILYPSVACNHKYENLALVPRAVYDLVLWGASEYLIEETYYNNDIDVQNELPIKSRLLRQSKSVTSGRISWDDD